MEDSRIQLLHGGAVARFRLGDKEVEYIDVTMFRDYSDGRLKLEIMGGTAAGIDIQPRSSNLVRVALTERSR